MKKTKIGFILCMLLLVACSGDKGNTTTNNTTTLEGTTSTVTMPETTVPTVTTPEITTPEVTTPEVTTPEPVVLEMTLNISKDPELDGTYRLKVGEEMIITPVFNVPGHVEDVTYNATESSLWGSSTSTNVVINNGVVKAVGKASKINLTVTSSINKLQKSIVISTYAELDNYDNQIKEKMDSSLIKEKEECSAIYYETSSLSKTEIYEVEIFNNGLEYAQSTITDDSLVEYYAYNGMYNDVYHSYKQNLTDQTASITTKNEAPSNLTLFPVKVSSMNSCNGVSAAAKYFYTNNFSGSSYNYALVETNNNSYSITTEYTTNVFDELTYTKIDFKVIFEEERLTGFEFERSEYDKNGYNFSENNVIGDPKSYTSVSAELTYGNRAESTSIYNPEQFYFTNYNVVLKDNNGNIGTTFQAGSALTFEYGNEYLPETALKDFDKLNFVSSSDISVVNYENGVLKCLSAGTSTLKFISDGGVEKDIVVTVEGEIVKLTDEEIKAILESKDWLNTSQNAFTGVTETKATLKFVNGKGEFVLTANGATMSFEYDVVEGELVISNLTSSSSNYNISTISFNDNISEITVSYTEKSVFGTSTYSLIMK